MIILNIIKTLRFNQFHKNIIIFAPLIFSAKIFEIKYFSYSFAAFILFTILSSSIYIINDIIDRDKDKNHPIKKNRPIASGKIPIITAYSISVILFISVIIISAVVLNKNFTIVVLVYFILMIFYCLKGRDIAGIDVIIVASGFVLRVFAGVEAISVPISPWLIICTFFAASILLLGKRYTELKLIDKELSYKYRKVYEYYDHKILQNYLNINYACAIICYCLYTISERTIKVQNSQYLYLTVPFVIYGIYRFQYLIEKSDITAEPETVIFKDKKSFVNILLWLISFFIIKSFGA